MVNDWRESDHPRDAEGRFTDAWAEEVAHRLLRGRSTPTLGTSADLDRAIAAGGVELWRGGNPASQRRLLGGDPDPGMGLYAHGIHAGSSSDAEYFATRGWILDEPPEGSMVRMVLPASARVLRWGPYEKNPEADEMMRVAREEAGSYSAARFTELAHAAGYDAIRIVGADTGATDDFDEPSVDDQYAILNHGVLLLEAP